LSAATLKRVGFLALVVDTAVVSAYVLAFSFEVGSPIRSLFVVAVVEAAARYGVVGGLAWPLVLAPVHVWSEWLRTGRSGPAGIDVDNVTLMVGIEVLMGMVVGWLVARLRAQTDVAEQRAAEAERLRDTLGRQVDVLDAANRCAHALGSSLELERAFAAFLAELRTHVPFDRVTIILAEGGVARVMAAAGISADEVFRPGESSPIEGSALAESLQGRTVYREDMSDHQFLEEDDLLAFGLRCRFVVPLTLGARAIGALSLSRAQPASFLAQERELVALLGRLVATAVQNIRTYDAERRTLDELRRLSTLRADFVSLVSHELRSPMASVIGSARTLRQRWRELSAEQREAFLDLIAAETDRLSGLIGDVLDTSRIEAGTFTYEFGVVDVAELVRDSVAAASLGQDEVAVSATVPEPLPAVRGDRERLRQVLANLLENAVKYSTAEGGVLVHAFADVGAVRVEVADSGPGIASEHHQLIFEKFGRVATDGSGKPGTGLGLFIARSIAEAHGGSLAVRSEPRRGATFTLTLPATAD
jgi:signal transduction histidine kinase